MKQRHRQGSPGVVLNAVRYEKVIRRTCFLLYLCYFSTVLRKARRNRDDGSYAKIVNDLITHMVLHVKLSDDEIVEKIRSVVGSGAEANNGEPDPARKTTKDVIHEV